MRHRWSGDEHDEAYPSASTSPAMSPRVRQAVLCGVAAAVVLLGVLVFFQATGDDPPQKRPAAAGAVTLAGIDGSYVLAGESPYAERLYRVDGGRLQRVAGQADFAGATTVTARGSTVIVALEDAQGRSTIRQARNGRLVSLGIASGYTPSLSADGTLAWASEDTPGTDQVTVFARDSNGSRQRAVATFDNVVVGTPLVIGVDWAGADLVVGIVRYGVLTALSYQGGRGPAKTVGSLRIDSDGGGRLAYFVAGGRSVVLTSEFDNLRRSLDDGARGGLPLDHEAVCITDTNDVLTQADGTLRLERDRRSRLVGRIPRSLTFFDVACTG